MSAVTRACAVRRNTEGNAWSSAADWALRAARSSKDLRADTEARLRQEFEEKGLYVLGISRAGGPRSAGSGCRLGPRFHAGIPRLQPGTGHAAQGRDASGPIARHPAQARREPALQVGAGRRLRAGAGGQLAVGGVRGARHAVSRCLYASLLAGEKSGSLEQVIRVRLIRKGCRDGQAQDDLGAGLSDDPAGLSSVSSRSSCCGSCRNSARSINNSIGRCRSRRGSSCRSRISPDLLSPDHRRRRGGRADVLGLDQEPAQRERFDRWVLQIPGLGQIARKFSTSQAARTLATLLGGGIPLVNAIDVAARSIKNPTSRASCRPPASRCARARAGPGDERERRVLRRRDQDGGSRRVDRRSRRC